MIFRTLYPFTYFKFDNFAYAKYGKGEKSFMTKFMDAQLFVCFIEDRPWPRSDLFDYFVESKVWDMPFPEFLKTINSAMRYAPTDTVCINLLEDSSVSEKPRNTTFCLNEEEIEKFRDFVPVVSEEVLGTPQKVSDEFTILYSGIPIVYALNPGLEPISEEWNAMVKSVIDSFDKWDSSSHEKRTLKRIVASFNQDACRNAFCAALLNLAETKASKNLSEATASMLSDLLHVMIEESPKDYALAFQCLEIADRFYYNNYNISTELSDLDIWKDIICWEYMCACKYL